MSPTRRRSSGTTLRGAKDAVFYFRPYQGRRGAYRLNSDVSLRAEPIINCPPKARAPIAMAAHPLEPFPVTNPKIAANGDAIATPVKNVPTVTGKMKPRSTTPTSAPMDQPCNCPLTAWTQIPAPTTMPISVPTTVTPPLPRNSNLALLACCKKHFNLPETQARVRGNARSRDMWSSHLAFDLGPVTGMSPVSSTDSPPKTDLAVDFHSSRRGVLCEVMLATSLLALLLPWSGSISGSQGV